jgi:prepilin-type N-terminal cleavage/methylation domain-containing protein
MRMLYINNKKRAFSIIELLIVIGIIGILAAMAVPPHHGRRRYDSSKSCFSNIRVLQGALEMYNMDHSVMIPEMNEVVIDILVREKYLKEAPVGPIPRRCKYYNQGDLTNTGVIYCEYHGSIDGSVAPAKDYGSEMTYGEYQERNTTFAVILGFFGLAALLTVIAIPAKKNKKV